MIHDVSAGKVCTLGTSGRHLTVREVEVLRLVAEGLDDADIAAKLTISVRTVQEHLKHLRRKTGAETRAGAITRAFASGVLLPGRLPPPWSGTFCLYVPADGEENRRAAAALQPPRPGEELRTAVR